MGQIKISYISFLCHLVAHDHFIALNWQRLLPKCLLFLQGTAEVLMTAFPNLQNTKTSQISASQILLNTIISLRKLIFFLNFCFIYCKLLFMTWRVFRPLCILHKTRQIFSFEIAGLRSILVVKGGTDTCFSVNAEEVITKTWLQNIQM